ncbi:hypothetical protein [Gimesia algae]|uniref:Uncharacterized protein n=1 Tax=Gimesia algae TaxID=2527971 RepID=A0A517VMQ2_9PLAN|nr:hypothetical protein [Gimesia algae]QDT94299.1 hypothetical protein Pan161_59940 [Gimesia algae]
METRQELETRAASQLCEAWNERYKIGTAVEYDMGTVIETTTRSAAWPLSGIPTILLNNVMGPVPLEYIKVVETLDR